MKAVENICFEVSLVIVNTIKKNKTFVKNKLKPMNKKYFIFPILLVTMYTCSFKKNQE